MMDFMQNDMVIMKEKKLRSYNFTDQCHYQG